jgi:asparagine synthase (glutamine-hydrolysing)
MCGIAGLFAGGSERYIGAMLNKIEHRGRDDEGVWTSDPMSSDGRTISLGHRRLAIIDTSSAGHQPMVSADGRYVITFGGEIYNYHELRAELKARGHEFKTETDTEVLLTAFAEWGKACLSRLNGMFHFAVWDNHERTLTLARDHVGIKPLYYAALPARDGQPSSFIFASEIKAILATRLVPVVLDRAALNQYLTFLWTPDPNTLFSGIKKLPPAHLLTLRGDINGSEIKTEEWWDVSFDDLEEGKSETWWQEQVRETLDRVVSMEMVADVPLGSFLSGGIDSSAIVAMMKHHSNGQPIDTYTIGIAPEDLRYDIIPDDLRWARRVNEQLVTNNHEIILNADVASLLPKLVYHLDEPVADPAIITSYLVSQAARETLRVLLSGVGGDEVFAGYPRLLAMKLAGGLESFPGVVRRRFMNAVGAALPGGLPGRFTAPLRNAKKFARSAALNFEDRYLGYGTYFTNEAKHHLYTPELSAANEGLDPYVEHRRYFARQQGADPLNRLLYVDLKTFLPCLNLAYTDKTSMAANLEVRVPFLNRHMIELAARMPPDLKLRGFKRKYILKRAMEKFLSKDVVWRKKAGFGAPVRSWLRGALRPMVDELLSAETIEGRGLFRPQEVKRIIDANLSGREDYSVQIFQLLTLELWQRQFMDGS